MNRGLKFTFFIHAMISGLVGIQHLIFPRAWTHLAGMSISETTTWRLIGAALIAFAASSWMAYQAQNWSEVKIIVPMEILWSFLGAATITWGILVEGLPPLEWLNVSLLIIFGMAFTIYGLRASAV